MRSQISDLQSCKLKLERQCGDSKRRGVSLSILVQAAIGLPLKARAYCGDLRTI